MDNHLLSRNARMRATGTAAISSKLTTDEKLLLHSESPSRGSECNRLFSSTMYRLLRR
jgi:hypothetical protein